jgi:hypothetical protein
MPSVAANFKSIPEKYRQAIMSIQINITSLVNDHPGSKARGNS